MLHIVPSYMPLSADDVSLHVGNSEGDMELPGLHWGRRRGRVARRATLRPEVEAEELWELPLPQSWPQPTATGCAHHPRGGEGTKLSFPTGADAV